MNFESVNLEALRENVQRIQNVWIMSDKNYETKVIIFNCSAAPFHLEIEFLTNIEHKPRWLIHSPDKRFFVVAHRDVIITCISLEPLQ